ncbi:hypothetical protein HWV62_24474 [Athelia sp. TMB]|nr:hypothetical protein HWV62_24474 [Athelia sp. TMB]
MEGAHTRHIEGAWWITPGGGRGTVMLNLLNCTEVPSVPSPVHVSAREDVGTIATVAQDAESVGEGGELMELLCPFQLLYGDGVERLAAESAQERALNRSVTVPDQSVTQSPTGMVRMICSITSWDFCGSGNGSGSGSGSRTMTFVPPMITPDLSDLESIGRYSSGTGGLSRAPSMSTGAASTFTNTLTNTLTATNTFSNTFTASSGLGRSDRPRPACYRAEQELEPPAHDESDGPGRGVRERHDARARTRARGGFGFASLGGALAGLVGLGPVLGEAGPVTVGSGVRQGRKVVLSPPPRPRVMSGGTARGSTSDSEDAFWSAGSRSSYTGQTGGFTTSGYTTYTGTATSQTLTPTSRTPTSRLLSDEMFSSSSATPITPSYRRNDSVSYLGDSHESYTSSSGPSRSSLSRRREVRRSPAAPRSWTSSVEESDKENSYTDSRSGTDAQWTLSTVRSSYPTSSNSYTRSAGTTPFPPSSYSSGRSAASAVEEARSDAYNTASSGSFDKDYETAGPSLSATSYHSLPNIPSESDFAEAELCKSDINTDFVTAEPCKSEVNTEFLTATLCRSEVDSEFASAALCKSDIDTEFVTAEVCKSIPDEDERSIIAPSIIAPSIIAPSITAPSTIPEIPEVESILEPETTSLLETYARDVVGATAWVGAARKGAEGRWRVGARAGRRWGDCVGVCGAEERGRALAHGCARGKALGRLRGREGVGACACARGTAFGRLRGRVRRGRARKGVGAWVRARDGVGVTAWAGAARKGVGVRACERAREGIGACVRARNGVGATAWVGAAREGIGVGVGACVRAREGIGALAWGIGAWVRARDGVGATAWAGAARKGVGVGVGACERACRRALARGCVRAQDGVGATAWVVAVRKGVGVGVGAWVRALEGMGARAWVWA